MYVVGLPFIFLCDTAGARGRWGLDLQKFGYTLDLLKIVT